MNRTFAVPANIYSRHHKPYVMSHPTYCLKGGGSNAVRTANSVIIHDAQGGRWLVFPAHLPHFGGGPLDDFTLWADTLHFIPSGIGDPVKLSLFLEGRVPAFKWTRQAGAMVDIAALPLSPLFFCDRGPLEDVNIVALDRAPLSMVRNQCVFTFAWPDTEEKWPPSAGSLVMGEANGGFGALMREEITRGFSGAPVFDVAYNFAGVIVGADDKAELYLPARMIWQLIHDMPVDPAPFRIADNALLANLIETNHLKVNAATLRDTFSGSITPNTSYQTIINDSIDLIGDSPVEISMVVRGDTAATQRDFLFIIAVTVTTDAGGDSRVYKRKLTVPGSNVLDDCYSFIAATPPGSTSGTCAILVQGAIDAGVADAMSVVAYPTQVLR